MDQTFVLLDLCFGNLGFYEPGLKHFDQVEWYTYVWIVDEDFLDDRNAKKPSLSAEDHKQKVKRSEFVRELLSSTILDDGL